MQIDLGSENPVNGTAAWSHLMLMVRVILCLPVCFSFRILVGGTIERWEDSTFRKCFENILNGNWREHDPFSLEGRLDARSSLYGRPNQCSIFRTFQGWLSIRWFYWRHDTLERILLTDGLIQWDRSNPWHYSFLPWRSALERIHHSETVLQPNSAF